MVMIYATLAIDRLY